MSTLFANKLAGHMLPEGESRPDLPKFVNLPEPMNYRVVLYPREIAKKSAGGIELPEETVESQENVRTVACVLQVGPTAFDPEVHPAWKGDKLEVGDWVLVPKYAGFRIWHRCTMHDQPQIKMLQIVYDADIICKFPEGLSGVVEL